MAHVGQELSGPGGMALRIVGLEPELLAMEATYSGDGSMPPMHLHPRQAERFEVLQGTMATVVGGVERAYGSGAVFEVPAGTPHQMRADGPARLRWEVRPALRTAEFFERMYTAPPSGAEEGAAFLQEFSEEFRLA
ncbi:MAG TPA: cupin domain-containing protein [Thermoleophilaceae bacterium]|jgi:mannose-6-phosphate isomerase-like protein (cupin superfamily)